jgi:DNA repair protein RecO (recombination protein O)
VQLAAGRSLEVVTQAQPIAGYYHLREDMERYAHACYAAELLDALTDEGDPDPVLYHILTTTLEALDAGGDPPTLIRGFELKLLGRRGYGPVLERCAGCGGELEGARLGFSAAHGGALCGRCVRGRGAVALSAAGMRALRELRRQAPQELAGRRLAGAVRHELERLMRAFVDYRLDRPLRSAAFLARPGEQEAPK